MSAAAEIHAPRSQPAWLAWLRREFAPFPSRKAMTARIVVTVVLVIIISLALQIPQLFFSAFYVFFVTKENRVLTMLTGVIMISGATIAMAISLLFFPFTFDYPELRIPFIAGMIFTGMFLSRVLVIGSLGLVIGFIGALVQTTAETAPNPDALVRSVLWLWVAVVYPIVLTMLVNQVLLPALPWTALVSALTDRLNTAANALERTLAAGAAGGQTNPALLELATRGSSPLLAMLNFAESKDAEIKRRHASLVETITASEHLLTATAALELRPRQTLSPDDLVAVKMLLAEIAQIKATLLKPNEAPGVVPAGLEKSVMPAAPVATLPQLRELELAADSFRAGLFREISSNATSPAPAKKSSFVPDAFTNPAHIRFALKVTLAAMICYLLCEGLNWRGINLAFLTCCFIALENTGATIRKGWLRLIGATAGGVMGYIALLFFIPHMDSITSLVILTAVGTAIAAWIAAGTDRISYAGLQCAFAFYLCIFEGFAPNVNFGIARDRLVGIVLGITVSSVVYRYVWPEHAIDALRVTLARVLRNLAQLLRLPETGDSTDGNSVADGEKNTNTLRDAITKDLDSTLRLTEVLGVEDVVMRTADHLSPDKLEQLTADTQTLCLMTNVLLGKTKLEEWQRLTADAQRAEIELRKHAAGQLQRAAAALEASKCPAPGDLEPDFSAWNKTVTQISGNDRPRLVHRLVEQIGKLN